VIDVFLFYLKGATAGCRVRWTKSGKEIPFFVDQKMESSPPFSLILCNQQTKRWNPFFVQTIEIRVLIEKGPIY
jgi:hypothetical protein